MRRKICKLILGLFIFSVVNVAFGKEENIIVVWCDKEIGEVNKKVFGNNFLGFDVSYHKGKAIHHYGHCNYGAGLWDGKFGEPVDEPIKLAKEAGVKVVRFPGGCGAHLYNWKDAVGERKHFLFGIDEFLKVAQLIGAEPIFTVSFFTGDKEDVKELAEYTKGRIKYFEIGNESWHGNHKDVKKVSPEEYAEKYLSYYNAIKKANTKAQVGAILWNKRWNQAILKIIKDKIDFGIVHIYPTLCWGDCLSKFTPEIIFYVTLALPEFQYQKYIKETLEALKKYAKKDVPLAVTEFNCGFVQKYPVPYRHTLGCALVNAELLKLFMKPENNILMANYWQFCNSFWGMIANGFNGDYKDLYKPYYKRPNFYVFEFYHKHFGDVLLETETECEAYNLKDFIDYLGEKYLKYAEVEIEGKDLLKNKKWIVEKVEGIEVKKDKADEEILVVEFKNPKKFNYYHTYKECEVEPDSFYKLEGFIRTEGLEVNEEEGGICLEAQDIRGWTKTKWAKSTQKIKGTTSWIYVEKIFKTLPDTKKIKIVVRRIGEKPPLKGRVFVKSVKLYKVKVKDFYVPYLSVNASKSKDGKKVYLMVINKNLKKDVEAEIRLKGFEAPISRAKIFVLRAKRVDATNEGFPPKVKVYKEEVQFKGDSFRYKFKKHSLTAIEIVGSDGVGS